MMLKCSPLDNRHINMYVADVSDWPRTHSVVQVAFEWMTTTLSLVSNAGFVETHPETWPF